MKAVGLMDRVRMSLPLSVCPNPGGGTYKQYWLKVRAKPKNDFQGSLN